MIDRWADGELATASKFNTINDQIKSDAVAEAQSKVASGRVLIGGTEYAETGKVKILATSYTLTNYQGVGAASVNLNAPYYPPSGYGFLYQLHTATGFWTIGQSGAGESNSTIQIRLMRIGSTNTEDITLVWRLVKTS